MNGKIWVESELDKGSIFHFTIKMKRGEEQQTALQQTVGSKQEQDKDTCPFTGNRILLVEDLEINREIVLSILEPMGLKIDCAENGVQAVKMFTEEPDKYKLIFMDVQMPEMDGYDATRRIREFEAEQRKTKSLMEESPQGIPILAMTANVFKEDVDKCLEAGMNDHVGKPLDFEIILEKLRTYLG
jgi:CheY-like chemotaxis protein